MTVSRLTRKGQATIPATIRAFLDLQSGDMIAFFMEEDKVVIQKAEPMDEAYLRSIEGTLSDEWLSKEDSEAYDAL